MIIQKNVCGDCFMGIWEITENYDELLDLAKLCDEDKLIVNSFLNEKRKLEWLSVRALTNQILKKSARIVYVNKKPILEDFSFNISISHSYDLTSVLLSKNNKVGIDLEFMSHKINGVSNKFINQNEVIQGNGAASYHLYLHWCAKEAIYKICDKQDINFKENITILPFEPSNEGQIVGHVKNLHIDDEFILNYRKHNNYAIVWTSKRI